MKNRRTHYIVNQSLQIRYMLYLTGMLLLVSTAILGSLYIGIWASILDSFSDERIQNDMVNAMRITQYEEVRSETKSRAALSFFKEAEKFSENEQQVFKKILVDTNKTLIPKFLILIGLIAVGSIFVSHKIAGPLIRLRTTMKEVGQGDLSSRVALRDGDELRFLAEDLNKEIENLDLIISRVKNILKENETNHERLVSRLKQELSKIRTSADSAS